MQLPGNTGAYLFTPEEAERLRVLFDSNPRNRSLADTG